MKIVLYLISVIGASLYGVVLALTFLSPGWLEKVGTEYIAGEVLETVDSTVDSIRPPAGKSLLDRAARKLYERNSTEVELAKDQLRTGISTVFVDALAQIRDLSCECRAVLEQRVASRMTMSIESLQSLNGNIVGFVQRSYAAVLQQISRDERIFSTANLLAFLGLLGALLVKPKAAAHLVLPASLLTIAAIVCSFFYIFEQNWLMTIIHNDYVGFGYVAWLSVVYAFLADVALNRARMTSAIVNGLASAVGSVFEMSPC